jgi:hypothetical protein
MWYGGDRWRLNGLPFSCAALIDRDVIVADAGAQNGPDLVAAQRRQLQWRVGRPGAAVTLLLLHVSIPAQGFVERTPQIQISLLLHLPQFRNDSAIGVNQLP